MLEQLLTEKRNPASENIDTVSTEEMVRIFNSEDAKVARAVEVAIPSIARAIDATADRLASGGRLFYVGAGTSGRLGVLDASECPPTFSVTPEIVQGIIAGGESALSRATEASEDDESSGVRDLDVRGLRPTDVLFGIAASGRTPYVLGAVKRAREMGALTGGISCSPSSALSALVELPIEVLPGPEVIAGSTRLKAGTATKLVLNTLSSGVMIRLGHVFGNMMVNVKQSNEKLKERARRIVADAGQVSTERASALLSESGSVQVSIVMARTGLPLEEAREQLTAAGGVVAKALMLRL